MTTPSPTETTKATSFMDLPAEIRNEIYELILEPFRYTAIEDFLKKPNAGTPKTLQQHPLTQANKAIRKETLSLIQGSKKLNARFFDEPSRYNFKQWFSSISMPTQALFIHFSADCCIPSSTPLPGRTVTLRAPSVDEIENKMRENVKHSTLMKLKGPAYRSLVQYSGDMARFASALFRYEPVDVDWGDSEDLISLS